MERDTGVENQQGEGTQDSFSAASLAVSGFMVIRFISGLCPANYVAWPIFGLTQGPSWWPMHLSAKMDSRMKDSGGGWWDILQVGVSPSSAPPEFSWLVLATAACSLSGTSVVRQLMQVVIIMPGQNRWFWSIVP